MRTRLVIALSTALLALSCAPPPDEAGLEPTASIVLGTTIMHDSLVFTFIQVFQIHIFEATSTAGSAVTCDDFPSRYKTNDPRLKLAVEKAISIANKWKQPPKAAELNPIQVPANKKLLIVIRGLAQTQQGPLAVASGCEDGLIFKDGAKTSVSIDVKATTGAPCLQQNECELTLICRSGTNLPGGYCAKVPCSGDASCPPGSHCVSDTAGGTTMCARACKTYQDCDTGYPQSQVCEGRQGPTSGGCAEVCVHPFWNKSNACTP